MSDLENLIFEAHSGVRWLVVLMTIVALGWLAWGMIQKRAYNKTTHTVVASWAGLVGLQWILGIVLFLVLGAFDMRERWEHFFVMTLALAAAHAYVPLKKRNDALRYRGGLGSIVAVLLLVYIGVALLPQGWTG